MSRIKWSKRFAQFPALAPALIWFLSGTLVFQLLDPSLGWSGKSPSHFQAVQSRVGNPSINSVAGMEIDRVEFTGVKSFTAQDLEPIMELGAGDKLERNKALKTGENLKALYLRHGFEQVVIRARLIRKKNERNVFETVLEYSVEEGLPIRIAAINLVPVGLPDESQMTASAEKAKRSWRRREPRLRARLKIAAGDIFNQEKLLETKRSMEELLASSDYIGSKVDHVRTTAEPPSVEIVKSVGPAARWVNLELRVDLGDRVSFGFRGNSAFTRGYLDGIVDEQRLLGLRKDYIKAIKTKLEDEYHAAGYARVEISPMTFESTSKFERKVTYIINEGPKVKVDSLEFDGNSVFSSDELKKIFYTKASVNIQHDIYVEKDIQKAAELVIEALKERGYLAARLITTHSTYLPKTRTQPQPNLVKVLVYLYEGERTDVGAITFQGASAMNSEEIQKILQARENSPLNLFAFGEGIEVLKKRYRDLGYLSFKIANEGTNSLIQYQQENHVANIFLQFDEGPQFRVSQIEIEGLNYTHEDVARRELVIKETEVLTEKDLVQSERRLRKLGIFSEIVFKTLDDPRAQGKKIVRINLKEADRGTLTYGPGYRDDLGIRAFSQLSYANLWGQNHSISLSASANRRFNRYQFAEGQFLISYYWPWFYAPELNFRPTVAVSRTQYFNLNADSIIAAANWDRQLLTSPNIIAYFSYSMEKIIQSQARISTDNGHFQIGSVTPKLSVDFRDSPLSPTRGIYSVIWLDLAHPYLGSQVASVTSQPVTPPIGYYRAQLRTDYYVPVAPNITWSTGLRMGYEETFNNSDSTTPQYVIPLIKEFALGGISSIRGWPEQGIFYSSSIVGGSMSYFNLRSQLDLPFAGALRFGLFFDFGRLWVQTSNYQQTGGLFVKTGTDNFSYTGIGTGFGFHYQTPVGPVNFDCGFKVNPPANADIYQLHFSVGVI